MAESDNILTKLQDLLVCDNATGTSRCGERGRPGRSFWRPAKNILRLFLGASLDIHHCLPVYREMERVRGVISSPIFGEQARMDRSKSLEA